MPYENLIYNETLMMELLLIALFLFFSVIVIMLFISIRDRKNHHPLLRPVSEPEKLAGAIGNIAKNIGFYDTSTSYLLESRKAISDLLSKKNIGLLLIQNAGNSSAVDIEIRTLGDYLVSDGPETKLTTMQAGAVHGYTFYLPLDILNDLMLYHVKIRYRNIEGKYFTSKFHIALSPSLSIKLADDTQLHVYVQM